MEQRDPAFARFIPLGDKDDPAIFRIYSHGVVTNRDPWVYNASYSSLRANVERLIEAYNSGNGPLRSGLRGMFEGETTKN